MTDPLPPHLTLNKQEFDVFSRPDASDLIARYDRGKPAFVVYGIATDYCVRAAVDGLIARECRVAVVVNAIRAIDPDAEAAILTDWAVRGTLLVMTDLVCRASGPEVSRTSGTDAVTPPNRPRPYRTCMTSIAVDFECPRPPIDSARDRARGGARLYPTIAPKDEESSRNWLDAAGANDLYVAKRKAAAVLGHRIRPGDLPSDDEVREQLVSMWRAATEDAVPVPPADDEEMSAGVALMADHLDRFAIYKLRLAPLESVKQNPRYHPEGDALYHSLQVFELARDARPYDEEFLLAALLHDVGKAVNPQDHVRAGVESLRGAVTERTLWLIEHHMDLLELRERKLSARVRREIEGSEYFEDLKLLRKVDDAGRVPGEPVESLDEALDYIRGLESESYVGVGPAD